MENYLSRKQSFHFSAYRTMPLLLSHFCPSVCLLSVTLVNYVETVQDTSTMFSPFDTMIILVFTANFYSLGVKDSPKTRA